MAERYEKALLSGSNFHSAAVMGTDMKRLCFDGTEPFFFPDYFPHTGCQKPTNHDIITALKGVRKRTAKRRNKSFGK